MTSIQKLAALCDKCNELGHSPLDEVISARKKRASFWPAILAVLEAAAEQQCDCGGRCKLCAAIINLNMQTAKEIL